MLQQYWRALPAPFRARLLHGSVGSFQCMRLASGALADAVPQGEGAAPNRQLLDAGRDLLLAAWECDPLNGDLARQVAGLDQQAPWLERATRAMLLQLAAHFSRPDNLRYFQRLVQQGDVNRIRSYLEGERTKAPENLYWLQQAVAVGELYGELAWALAQVREGWPAGLELCAGVRIGVEAHLLAAMGHHDEVVRLTGGNPLAPESVGPGRCLLGAERRAHSLWMLGDRAAAHALWQALLAVRPWHVNLLLRLYDSLMEYDRPTPPEHALPGRTAALLYSWNKADDLDRALASVAVSAEGLSRIVALDNGSTDGTGAVIDAWAERLGERMLPIHLPVNVGAPAARNWLKHLPEMAETEFVAYLDDDAILPGDWLGHMGRAVAAYPAASVWGGKIVDHHAPHVIQSADLHMVMAAGTEEEIAAAFSPVHAHAVPFNVTDIHAQMADVGGFDYMRPCVSVTGCCHLFRTAELMAAGDFSLSLSPSQYDDLEHDLRMALQGRYCVYTGFLPVQHMKRTGKATRMSPGQFGNGLGNKYKLHALYGRQDVERIMQSENGVLEQDLLEKAQRLDQALSGA